MCLMQRVVNVSMPNNEEQSVYVYPHLFQPPLPLLFSSSQLSLSWRNFSARHCCSIKKPRAHFETSFKGFDLYMCRKWTSHCIKTREHLAFLRLLTCHTKNCVQELKHVLGCRDFLQAVTQFSQLVGCGLLNENFDLIYLSISQTILSFAKKQCAQSGSSARHHGG